MRADRVVDRSGLAGRIARWLVDLRIPILIAVGSRVYSVALIVLGRQLGRPETFWPLLTTQTGPFAAWDGQWYLSIAASGYHATPICVQRCLHDFAFPPVWPIALWVVSLGGAIDPVVAGVVLANLLFVLAAILVYLASVPVFGSSATTRGLLLFCFGPAAYVGSMLYSESLFLVLVGLFFVARRPGLTGLAAAFGAQLVRVTGLTLAGVALWEAWRGRAGSRSGLLILALAPLIALGLWWTYVAVLTGNVLGLLQGTPGWYQTGASGSGLTSIVTALQTLPIFAWPTVAVVAAYAVLTLALIRHDARFGIFALLTLAAALVGDWHSMPRYLLPAFPVPMLAAMYAGRRGTLLLWGVGALLQAVFVAGTIGGLVAAP